MGGWENGMGGGREGIEWIDDEHIDGSDGMYGIYERLNG